MQALERKIKFNIGCPNYCKEWFCVDENPKDSRVIRENAISFLARQPARSVDEIYSKNMLEHLPNPGSFFTVSYFALKEGGKLRIITDNAEWFLFYIPLLCKFGIGAHSRNDYVVKNDKTCNSSSHYMLFTKMHLRNFCSNFGFEVIYINRMKRVAGARLDCLALKISGK
jgi:hypothetical protein